MLSGGALSRCAFFALGVSPYINSSIITQLLCVALPSWEALQKETTGKDKLDEYTKRIALAMAAIMSIGYYFVLRNYGALEYTAGKSGFFAAVVIMATFLAGSQLSVWIGGRIDEFGIGNGVSILIFAGIVSRWTDINTIAHNIAVQVESGNWLYSLVGIGMVVAMLFAVWFVSYSDGAERRIPVQYAARKYNARGQASYIPVKLLMSGVMPIIFAGVIMSIPATVDMFVDATKHVRLHSVLSVFSSGSWIYYAVYVILIALFNFFYEGLSFRVPKMVEAAKKLVKSKVWKTEVTTTTTYGKKTVTTMEPKMDEDGNPVFDEDGTIVMERVSKVVKTANIKCLYSIKPSQASKKVIMEYFNVPQDEDTVESDTSEADLFDEEAATMRQLYNAAEADSQRYA